MERFGVEGYAAYCGVGSELGSAWLESEAPPYLA